MTTTGTRDTDTTDTGRPDADAGERADAPQCTEGDAGDVLVASVPDDADELGAELEVFDDAVDPRIRARWIEARRAEGRRRLYVLCAVVGTLAVAVIAYVIAHSSLLGAGSVDVHGVPATSAATIRAAADVPDGAPLLFLDTGAVARRVEALPTVARAQVSTDLPSTVVIRVTLRTPIAWTNAVRSAPPVAVLDRDGRVLARTGAPLPGLVRADGVGIAGALGSRVSGAAALRALGGLPAALRTQVASFAIRPGVGPVLVLAGPDPVAAEIHLGSLAQMRAKATAALAVLDRLAAQGSHVRVLGVQVPDAPVTQR
jgi:cell division protein FtsQ